MKKLWIVTELFPPDETSTSYILGEIAIAMSAKYDVNVICGSEVYDKRKEIVPVKFPECIKIFRAKGIDLDKNTFFGKAVAFIVMSWRLLKIVKRKVGEGDVVLMVTNPAPLVPLMARLKRAKKFELNILVHDVFPENTIPAGLALPKFVYENVKKVFDRAYAKADRLIAIGRDMADVLYRKTAHYASNLDICIIENWGDTENIKPLPFPEGKIILQYAGNVGRVQALDEVIKDLPEYVDFHIYGTGAMEDTLKKIGKQNVFFHGPYKRSQQKEILGACDIALVTLQEEMYGLGVPSKTYNILASGRPILFFGPKNSEIDRLVKEKQVGYCSWPKVWVKAELEIMGKRARVLAEAEYSKEKILKKIVDTL